MKFLRGWFGEKKTTFSMWLSINSRVYKRFHDLVIKSKNGTAQIDHILVSPYGVFIVETKNMKGWIFGSEDQPRWTQSLYGKNYPFQNPLRQTYRQKKVLSEFLEIHESAIHTVVCFVGDCKFKTRMPANVIRLGVGSYIKKFRKPVFSEGQVNRMVWVLEKYSSESALTTRDHVRSLRERHSSTTVCPSCGSGLVVRTAKKGPKAGSRFLGCQSYPRCRFTRSL